ncbi:hypothetical protein T4E_1661 [Trichinella pseudospiralis]|uniref:Uncharacterized protein n=1 Tax=Trichinella pseudospiralis TaxID=6337 RepID=A0A0V0Y8K8_TRIPS|nr:hypothetical protein T4E_1661 [Trichinella pseudospiralis]
MMPVTNELACCRAGRARDDGWWHSHLLLVPPPSVALVRFPAVQLTQLVVWLAELSKLCLAYVSEFRQMAASEAAMLIGQFCCATVSPPTALDSSRQDVGIAECDSNSAAPHPASSNAALFVIIVSPASPILFNLFRCSVKTEETIYYLNLQLPNVVCLAGLLPGTIVHQMEES